MNEDRIHPFRKYFEEIQPGDSLLTPRRTLTEADIVNFACLSGDHFYAHMDKIAAAESIFGERVVHGYFLIAAAAGLFVDAGVGPVIANYGMENLRFIEPVKPGDTIQVRLTCKRKTVKRQRSADESHRRGGMGGGDFQPAPAGGGAVFHSDPGGASTGRFPGVIAKNRSLALCWPTL